MAKYNDERLNISGKCDSTAYSAIQNIRREEKRKLITKLKLLANQHGYRIVGKICLKETEDEENG